jgi:hypothetical protein
VLRRMFGSNREEITVRWRTFHNEELHNLYSSPDISRVIKSRRMRSQRHVARMSAMRNIYKILFRNSEG